ncbi:MAG: hypothetical protein RL456_494 [Pseudomonadota bacterium]
MNAAPMTAAQNLRVTLLGPDIDHRASLEAMLGDQVGSTAWIHDSSVLYHARRPTLGRRVRRALDQVTGTQDPEFRQGLTRHLDEHGSDVVVAYWGTNPLADLLAVRKLRPRVKLVLMVLCFPLALEGPGIARQHWLMRRAARHIDGLLFPSVAMQRYFHEHRLLPGDGSVDELVLPPCWPASFQPHGAQERQPATAERANLIFVGRTDLSHATIHAADDLRTAMREVLDTGVELHHVRSPETTDGHPMRRPFEPASQADLIRRMATHDASLIKYNTEACSRPDRFDVTVPDRLITSVAAGVPIALPEQGYQGSKEYLARYPAVIQFRSMADLAAQLADRGRVAELREQAWKARHHYAAEAHGPALAAFLARLGQARHGAGRYVPASAHGSSPTGQRAPAA